MSKWWDLWAEVGEMMGSFILTFGVLISILVCAQKSMGIDTRLKKRIFMGAFVPASVLLGLIATKGFGGHGQINPAITLMVAAIESHFEQVPATIGFQLAGATVAALLLLITYKLVANKEKLEDVYKFNDQGIVKTTSIEMIGNVFWLLPIAGMVVGYIHHQINFFELALAASFGKMILVGAFEEFGAANFNSQIWFGKMIVTFVAQKGKITKRQVVSEMSGLFTTMIFGLAAGYMAYPFHKNLPYLIDYKLINGIFL